MTRRNLVGAAGTGLAVAAAGGQASAQQPGATAQPMSDPTSKYPKPPFEKQSQPWPGLGSGLN